MSAAIEERKIVCGLGVKSTANDGTGNAYISVKLKRQKQQDNLTLQSMLS